MKPYSFFILIVFVLFFTYCKKTGEASVPPSEEDKVLSLVEGEMLAKAHCGRCHLYTEPALLDKNTWQRTTLPEMGYRMGIYHGKKRQSLIENNQGGKLVEERGIYPSEPILSEAEWQAIVNFYTTSAPDSLSLPSKDIKGVVSNVKQQRSTFHISPPMITAINYHPALKQFFVADAKADYSTINILNQAMESVNTLAIPSPISHLTFRSDTILATLMGRFMPTDNPTGSIIKIFKPNASKEYQGFISVLKGLQRPVHANYEDMNADGREDIVVCEYGNHTGRLSLYLQLPNGQYAHQVLSADPGATKTVIKDMNEDGRPDVVALMAQGNERIDVHYNLGQGRFEAQTLLRFPPSYGSVAMSLVDWNKDGKDDIIYVNGDNADYSMVLKPYHGLRIFLNDGANHFEEAYFLHQDGAYRAIDYDFDYDGDIDIVLTSFFPNLVHHPEEGVIYLENVSATDSIAFDLHTFAEASSGRWLIAHSADVDEDKKPEIVLGSFTGMAINGDEGGQVVNKFIAHSPTLLLLDFTSK